MKKQNTKNKKTRNALIKFIGIALINLTENIYKIIFDKLINLLLRDLVLIKFTIILLFILIVLLTGVYYDDNMISIGGDLVKEEKKLQKVQFNFPVDLVQKIDNYAEKMNINRTSAVSVLCNIALTQDRAIDVVDEMITFMKNNDNDIDKDK